MRSAGLNATGRVFVLAIIDSVLAGGRGRCPATTIKPSISDDALLVGLGAVGGAAVLVRWRPRRQARTGFVLLVVQGLAILLLAAPGQAAATVACLIIGITAGSASALLSAVFVRTIAPNFLGRVASMQRLGDDVLMPAAMAGFGALAGGASLPVAFTVFGGAMAALTLLTATSQRWRSRDDRARRR